MIKGRASKSVRTRQEMWSPQMAQQCLTAEARRGTPQFVGTVFRVYDSVRQRYNFLGLVPLFATTHLPICPQVTLDLLPPPVVPTFALLPPPHSFSPLVVRRSFLRFFVLFVCLLKPLNGRKLLPKAPGQDLAQKGRFPMVPEEF